MSELFLPDEFFTKLLAEIEMAQSINQIRLAEVLNDLNRQNFDEVEKKRIQDYITKQFEEKMKNLEEKKCIIQNKWKIYKAVEEEVFNFVMK